MLFRNEKMFQWLCTHKLVTNSLSVCIALLQRFSDHAESVHDVRRDGEQQPETGHRAHPGVRHRRTTATERSRQPHETDLWRETGRAAVPAGRRELFSSWLHWVIVPQWSSLAAVVLVSCVRIQCTEFHVGWTFLLNESDYVRHGNPTQP